MDIKNLLKEKRAEAKLTQEQLAEKIFVSKKTISNWETGKTTPDIDSLVLLAKLFDFSLDTLLLEGSDLVENIKKIEAAKVARKYFWLSWGTNIIFLLIISTQKFFGELSAPAFSLVTIGIMLNFLTLMYFAKRVAATNDNRTLFQLLKSENKPLLVAVIVLLIFLFGLIVL
ncbi:helix-turn-helix transcriptional regulator [Enterococcus sp. LJL120]